MDGKRLNMKIAIIPARGGSKRIPRKNIRDFAGKPMIAWSIQTALASGIFDRVIVSTDDIEIADISRQWGADVPFQRPAELADDFTPTIPVVAHAVSWCQENMDNQISAVCCIYSSPFVTVHDLLKGLDLLEKGYTYSFAATEFPSSVFRAFGETPEKGVEMLFPDKFSVRSQDLQTMFYDAGQFYWGTPSSWLVGKPFFASHSSFVKIPKWRVHDIDTLEDWTRAEIAAKILLEFDGNCKLAGE